MLAILHEDAHLLAVNKPAGLLTQGWRLGEPTVERLVREHLEPVSPNAAYVGTVHRLDRPVSGVLVWAKTPKAARRLAGQFTDRETKKEYWAVVAGRPSHDQGVWEDWLFDDNASRGVVQVCRPGAPRARRAVTLFQWLANDPSGAFSWLRLYPETGRTHQLRIQSASRGLPVVGDVAYGSNQPFSHGIALHARSLAIAHPVSGERMTFTVPPPASWNDFGSSFDGFEA